MPCTGCVAGERGPASYGRDNEGLAVAPLPREHYSPIMVVHPDETVAMACKLAASPKQPKSEGVRQRSFAWFPQVLCIGSSVSSHFTVSCCNE